MSKLTLDFMHPVQRFRAACGNKPVDKPPVWMMRQAGRTLPEYHEIRKKYSFWEVCQTPELAAEVTLQPLKRFPVDAAVIFSDILTIPAAMGQQVEFKPKISLLPPVRHMNDIEKLQPGRIPESLDYVNQAILTTRKRLGNNHAILGFSGAPYTLACYMVEGGSSKTFHRVKQFMHSNPDAFTALMNRLSDAVINYLNMQINASVDAVQIFDSWAGELSPVDFRNYVLPHLQRIIKNLSSVPVIYYINGIGNLLDSAYETGAQVMGIDWRVSLRSVRNRLGSHVPVQGNLDPSILFAPVDVIRKRVFEMLDETNGQGHIVNLGHGLNPETPVESIETFVQSVSEWSKQRNLL